MAYLNDSFEPTELCMKMTQPQLATALYRAVTEKHAFYSCETVQSAVTTQFIRDLKGTLISIFNENTNTGKRYMFDIQRTCREVHDHARRVLHSKGIPIAKSHIAATTAEAGEGAEAEGSGVERLVESVEELEAKRQVEVARKRKIDQEVAKQMAEAVQCRICMDHSMDAMFSPCGHIMSCTNCANR